MISVFILGIGLIMLATVFPVAGNWARQSSEETVGLMIGPTAVTVLSTRYTAADLSGVGTNVVAIPNIPGKLPWTTRFYAMGQTDPWPVTASRVPPMYCWTALIRRQPGQVPGTGNRFDVFVMVCKKGDPEQTFGTDAAGVGRASTDLKDVSTNTKYFTPYIGTTNLANMPVGTRGVGASSGTVFRKLSAANETSLPVSDANIWYIPAADGADVRSSPLVYVYQATLDF